MCWVLCLAALGCDRDDDELFGSRCSDAQIAACDDGEFCNGTERCELTSFEGERFPRCAPGARSSRPCLPDDQACDEVTDRCVEPECIIDSDCEGDDGNPCTDLVCVERRCVQAVDCASEARAGCACDDGIPCTEGDVCAEGRCEGEYKTCPEGEFCDFETGECVVGREFPCCLPAGGCEVLGEAECEARAGLARVFSDTCEEVACATGACCLPSGSCGVVTEAGCAEDGGVYRGDDALCEEQDCELGACCVGGACSARTASACEVDDGAYQGVGSQCALDTCGGEVVGCCLGDRCEEVLGEEACAEQGGSRVGASCPVTDPASCESLLVGAWSMRNYDRETGRFSGSSAPYYVLADGNLIDGRPTNVQTDGGPVSLFYQLYAGYTFADGVFTAEGCPLPGDFPERQFWTVRTIRDGALTRDPCTGECVLSFEETLVTTDPGGDVSTSVFFKRSVGHGDHPEGLCYRACVEACNPAHLPGRCWRTPPDPPWSSEYMMSQEAWLQAVLESRTCVSE